MSKPSLRIYNRYETVVEDPFGFRLAFSQDHSDSESHLAG